MEIFYLFFTPLWCCAQGRGAAACDARLVSAARGVQRAQQGAARALFPILSPILFPIFGKANSRDFPPKKILTIAGIDECVAEGILSAAETAERRSLASRGATQQCPRMPTLSMQELSKYFKMPEKAVAKHLGICLTSLKKICRANGINRWPYRKVRSVLCCRRSESASCGLGNALRYTLRMGVHAPAVCLCPPVHKIVTTIVSQLTFVIRIPGCRGGAGDNASDPRPTSRPMARWN
jgi:hypothetical protein